MPCARRPTPCDILHQLDILTLDFLTDRIARCHARVRDLRLDDFERVPKIRDSAAHFAERFAFGLVSLRIASRTENFPDSGVSLAIDLRLAV